MYTLSEKYNYVYDCSLMNCKIKTLKKTTFILKIEFSFLN